MNILLKSVKIIDSKSKFNNIIKDVLISDGIIVKIEDSIKAEANWKVIEIKDACVSPGWVDVNANCPDPGFEYKENFTSLNKAAVYGGYTTVLLSPLANPVRDNKAQVEYVINNSKPLLIDVLPLGAISSKLEGKELAEMYDMFSAGAVAFSDAKNPVMHSGLMMRALLYAKQFDATVISYCDDKNLSQGGKMNEGVVSTSLGLKPRPAIAESVMLNRDITLLNYTESKLHVNTVSCIDSIKEISNAKKAGLSISANVSINNLFHNEEVLKEFDTNFKLLPPLRDEENRVALVKAVKDKVIDIVVSDHTPEDVEVKKVEFDGAAFGSIGLETCFGAMNKVLSNEMNLQEIIDLISHNPRRIFGLKEASVNVDVYANLTLFNPNHDWIYDPAQVQSSSKNSCMFGKKLKGKALGVINKGGFALV